MADAKTKKPAATAKKAPAKRTAAKKSAHTAQSGMEGPVDLDAAQREAEDRFNAADEESRKGLTAREFSDMQVQRQVRGW